MARGRPTHRAVRLEKLRRRGREDFTTFKKLVYRGYQSPPHLRLLDQLLMQVSLYAQTSGAEGIGRAIIEMPPRHGKTVTTSQLFPAWHLGRNPDHRIMAVSYGSSLAESNSRVARDVLKSERYHFIFPRVHLSDASRSVSNWSLNPPNRGGMMAFGVKGAVTGKGANLLIIDDPLKNREEAESADYRHRLYHEIFQEDLYTRLEPGGAIILMATRWHSEDLTGMVLRDNADEWHRLTLPALAHKNDPLGRPEGAALWPERYDEDYLRAIMAGNPYRWASLYDQNPVPRSGGLFKYEHIADHRRLVDDIPPLVRIVVAVDPSGSERGDEVGVIVAGRDADYNGYVLHDGSLRARTETWAKAVANAYRDYKADLVVAETNFGGDMVRASIQAHDPSIPYKGVTASRGKVLRAEPIAVLYSRGLVHHVGVFPQLEQELTMWTPGSDSPNRLDALVWAMTELLMDRRGKLVAKGRPII